MLSCCRPLSKVILILGSCSVSQFRCNYGYCISSDQTCNGASNCYYGDLSDERGCGMLLFELYIIYTYVSFDIFCIPITVRYQSTYNQGELHEIQLTNFNAMITWDNRNKELTCVPYNALKSKVNN